MEANSHTFSSFLKCFTVVVLFSKRERADAYLLKLDLASQNTVVHCTSLFAKHWEST